MKSKQCHHVIQINDYYNSKHKRETKNPIHETRDSKLETDQHFVRKVLDIFVSECLFLKQLKEVSPLCKNITFHPQPTKEGEGAVE
jgi:hypothetical protein